MTIDSADDSKISNRTINTNRSRIGRTIRNRIESRSFAGPYLLIRFYGFKSASRARTSWWNFQWTGFL